MIYRFFSVGLLVCVALCCNGNASIVRVPGDWPSVQQGLDALFSGDTLLVADSEYVEALIAPPITFWLIGDVAVDSGDFSRPIVDASMTPDTVHRGCLTLPAGSSATIERMRFRNRFEIWHRGGVSGGGVRLESDTAAFYFCAFDSTYGAITQPQANEARIRIDHCTFTRNRFAYVFLYRSECQASNCVFDGYGGALYQLVCGSGSNVEGCVFRNAGMTSLTNWGEPNFTVRNCVFGPTDSSLYYYVELVNYSGHFENNLFTGLAMYSHALELEADCMSEVVVAGNTFSDCNRPQPGYQATLLHIHCAGQQDHAYLVTGNEMVACAAGGVATGIWASGSGVFLRNRLHDLVNNLVNPGLPAVLVATSDTCLFRENLFYSNDYAMQAALWQEVDARWNWWGDSTGPYHPVQNPNGLGDSVSNGVLFAPWLVDSALAESPTPRAGLLPAAFALDAYPNPFNGSVTLKLIPPDAMIVRVELFDILGRRIQEIWSGPLALEKQVTFDSNDIASGIYFVRVWQPIGYRQLALKKLVLLK